MGFGKRARRRRAGAFSRRRCCSRPACFPRRCAPPWSARASSEKRTAEQRAALAVQEVLRGLGERWRGAPVGSLAAIAWVEVLAALCAVKLRRRKEGRARSCCGCAGARGRPARLRGVWRRDGEAGGVRRAAAPLCAKVRAERAGGSLARRAAYGGDRSPAAGYLLATPPSSFLISAASASACLRFSASTAAFTARSDFVLGLGLLARLGLLELLLQAASSARRALDLPLSGPKRACRRACGPRGGRTCPAKLVGRCGFWCWISPSLPNVALGARCTRPPPAPPRRCSRSRPAPPPRSSLRGHGGVRLGDGNLISPPIAASAACDDSRSDLIQPRTSSCGPNSGAEISNGRWSPKYFWIERRAPVVADQDEEGEIELLHRVQCRGHAPLIAGWARSIRRLRSSPGRRTAAGSSALPQPAISSTAPSTRPPAKPAMRRQAGRTFARSEAAGRVASSFMRGC